MGPEELDQYFRLVPMPDVRLTLSSGDVVIITDSDRPFIAALTLVLRGERDGQVTRRSRLISLPNIAMAEVADAAPASRRRRLR
jgi:hypothetical protein